MNLNIRKPARLVATMLGTVALSVVFTPNASAGCGTGAGSIGALNAKLLSSANATKPAKAQSEKMSDAAQPGGADIVGMWAVTMTAKNNPDGPPDGTPIDEGFSQWHSDGTEIMNSSRPPATGNFCLGVWNKVGPSTYKLTHKVLNFDASGILIGPGTIHEEVIVDRSRTRFAGTFSIDLYDTAGNLIAHVNGEMTATRITVD
jgi:hypothetical protein